MYLSGKEDRYAVYQIISGTKGKDYRFMGLDFVVSHDMKVDAADYGYVYGGRLSGEETLDSLYENSMSAIRKVMRGIPFLSAMWLCCRGKERQKPTM